MAHLWKNSAELAARDESSGPSWVDHRLDEQTVFELGGTCGVGAGGPGVARILCSGNEWLLLAWPAAGVAVNGVAVSTGVRVLSDLDEIHSAGTDRVFFSTERPPAVVAYPASDSTARCPRCQQPIDCDSPSVRCRCGAYYHQSEALPCYTYGPCVVCAAATDLDGSYLWTPEGL